MVSAASTIAPDNLAVCNGRIEALGEYWAGKMKRCSRRYKHIIGFGGNEKKTHGASFGQLRHIL
jgi:hypothetical protein